MKTIAILGSKENIGLFRSLGLRLAPVETKDEALDKLESLCSGGDYALILITERWEEKLEGKLEQFKYQPSPAICSVPVDTGAKEGYLEEVMERAIGSDIELD
jgi:vacuolar-type H+-ATPase subunit F/Vma7